MKEDLAFQNKSFIENLFACMYDRPYLYVVLLVGIVVFITCRQKEMSFWSSMIVSLLTVILGFIALSYVWPF